MVATTTTFAAIAVAATLLAGGGVAPARAQSGAPTVTVNGQAVAFIGQGPISQNGRTLVPLRGVLEKLGAYVQYNGASKVVTAIKGQTTITLLLGQSDATINGRTVRLDVPAMSLNGSTMVPLRFVAENLNAQVNFNVGANTIAITTAGGATSGGTTPAPTTDDNIVTTARVVSVDAVNRTIVLRMTSDGGGFNRGARATFTFARGATIDRVAANDDTLTRLRINDIAPRDSVRIRARASDKNITSLRVTPARAGGAGDNGATPATGSSVKGVFVQADELENKKGFLIRMVGGQSVEAPRDVTVLYGGDKINVDDLRSGDTLTISVEPTTKVATRIVVTVEN